MKVHSQILILLMLIIPAVSHAIGPHEVVVLVNRNSRRSITVGNEFANRRSVPPSNILPLSLPGNASEPGESMSRDDFTRHIWEPVTEAIKTRGIGDHVLAWIYSVDFPIRVNTAPPMSIQGLTFTRNQVPGSDAIRLGTYISPLFAGPDADRARRFPSQSFDVLRSWLGGDMPIPSMALGVARKRGNSVETIIECIGRGKSSDHTAPTGTVFLVTSADVRAKCRAWQFRGAQAELLAMGVHCAVTNAPPSGKKRILGVLMGSPSAKPKSYGSYVPGAMAEHLTSFAAVFDNPAQTKLSEWIKAGATASAGAVVEPMANWRKFPNARYYVHYAAGCTIIESFYQSVRSPLQILFVGEPLACPWAPRASISLEDLPREPLKGTARVTARVTSTPRRSYTRFVFLIDGKTVQSGRSHSVLIDSAHLPDGFHGLRAVAYDTGGVRSQVFVEDRFEVRKQAK